MSETTDLPQQLKQELKRLLAKRDYTTLTTSIEEARKQYGAGAFLIALEQELHKRQSRTKQPQTQDRSTSRFSKPQVKLLACPACKVAVDPPQHHDLRIFTCRACGQPLELDANGQISIPDNSNKSTLPAYRWLLRLGQRGHLGYPCELVGRLIFTGSLEEWDSEDKQYEHSRIAYDEWVLRYDDGRLAYITEYQDGSLYLSHNHQPSCMPDRVDFDLHYLNYSDSGVSERILEKTRTKLQGFEGEFSYLPDMRADYYSVETGAGLSIAWYTSAGGSIAEVECFRSRPISRKELAFAFSYEDYLNWLAEEERLQAAHLRWACVPYAMALFLLALSIGSFFVKTPTIFKTTLPAYAVTETGNTLGPIELKHQGAPYSLELASSGIDVNSWLWVGAELLDAESTPVSAYEGDFWFETGRDEDGPWSEKATSSTAYFRLSKPGTYYLRVFNEANTSNSNRNAQIHVKINKSPSMPGYYLVAAGLCAIFGCIVQFHRNRFKFFFTSTILGVISCALIFAAAWFAWLTAIALALWGWKQLTIIKQRVL